MKLLRQAFHGLCGFAGGELDLRQIPPGLITLAGPNWTGKTTLLELPLAALYREWASRTTSDITKWADLRDSWVEVDLELGDATYRARVNIDGPSRKSQAVLSCQRPDGSWQALTDGKVSTFDEAIAGLVPPMDALLCSQFAAQNRAGSLTGASRAKRKDLFIHFLWLDRLVEMAETAKQCAAIAETTAMVLRSRIEQLEKESSPDLVELLERRRDIYRLEISGLENGWDGIKELTARIAAAETESAALSADVDEHAAAQLKQTSLSATIDAAQRGIDSVPAAIEKATKQSEQDVAGIARWLAARLKDLDVKIEKQRDFLRQADACRAAAQEGADLAREIERMRSEATEAAHQRVALTDTLRDATAAETAETVPCGGIAPYDRCQFLAEAVAARTRLDGRTAHEVRQALQVLTDDAHALQASQRAAQDRLSALKPAADLVPALDQAADRLEEYLTSRKTAETDASDRRIEIANRMAQTALELNDRADALRLEIAETEQLLADMQPTLDRTSSAKSRVSNLSARLKADTLSLADCEKKKAALTLGLEESERGLAAVADRLASIETLAPRLSDVEDALRVQSLLAKALHRDGLPTLEIAAAAPAISQLTTDLLEHSGFGTRFRVDVTTLVPTADGTEWKEDFAIRVYDNERGKEILDVGDLSGGERILVEEALRAALTIYMAARHTHKVETCWRDESSGPLDAENRPKYISMLRRLKELGGYSHVIFISQSSDCVDLADTIVDVHQGAATVRRAV